MGFINLTSLIAQDNATPTSVQPSINILAGNSRLDIDAAGAIRIEAQLQAFRAALIYADDLRRQTGKLPPVSIAFDHKGVFRRQFLRDGLSNSQKRNPRLCHLRTEIVDVFGPIAEALNIPTEHILVIHEDSARTHADHMLNTVPLSADVRHRMVVAAADRPTCGAPSNSKITCAAITSEYFCKAIEADDESLETQPVLEVFFEASPWSEVLAYVRGLQLTHALGMRFGIRLNLVTPEGTLRKGQVVYADPEPPVSSALIA
ncbi:hypothetical protein [Dyella sp. 2HG41-7]|uniref:hypothetical protein n=1 Tax=Dyella sp. 2HG41-7 TaxID=2883239 RepID=UPI001F15D54C|nr:hypothetical protein [Dyella sp. 2HG41-7]